MFVRLFVVFRNNEGSRILETFIKSGLHPIPGHYVEWPTETVTVCLIEHTPGEGTPQHTVIRWNSTNPSIPALEKLMDYIVNEENPTEVQSITIYINYSPSTQCSRRLVMLKMKFKIKVRFSSFYLIRRPSCAEADCNCHGDDPEAIRKLTELEARPFHKEDWDDLIKLLMRNDEQEGHPYSDLNELRFGDRYGVWRNREDAKMEADYEQLIQ